MTGTLNRRPIPRAYYVNRLSAIMEAIVWMGNNASFFESLAKTSMHLIGQVPKANNTPGLLTENLPADHIGWHITRQRIVLVSQIDNQ